MKKKIGNSTLEIIQGNIASQPDMQAIVNAANAQLRTGGGVAGAIHRAAGPGLEKECIPLGPIKPGEAVISGGHNLPNEYVIHCLGPVYGKDKPEDKLLADCYRNALLIADENKIESIAFPAISTGIFGYPATSAAQVAFDAMVETVPKLENVKTIRIVLFGQEDLEIWEKTVSYLLVPDAYKRGSQILEAPCKNYLPTINPLSLQYFNHFLFSPIFYLKKIYSRLYFA